MYTCFKRTFRTVFVATLAAGLGGGTAIAQDASGSKAVTNLKCNGCVNSKDIKNGSVSRSDIKNSAVRAKHLGAGAHAAHVAADEQTVNTPITTDPGVLQFIAEVDITVPGKGALLAHFATGLVTAVTSNGGRGGCTTRLVIGDAIQAPKENQCVVGNADIDAYPNPNAMHTCAGNHTYGVKKGDYKVQLGCTAFDGTVSYLNPSLVVSYVPSVGTIPAAPEAKGRGKQSLDTIDDILAAN